MEHLTFLTTAIRDRNVGAVAPSSPVAVKHICKQIDHSRPVVVVEYGPGTGAFSRYLLKNLHPDSTLIGIEMNRAFARKLRNYRKTKRIRKPNFIVACDDARNIESILAKNGFKQADYVLSGIPFSFLDDESKDQIVQSTRSALAEDGKFLVYQYSFAMREPMLKQFEEVKVGRCLLNLPPMCVMQASGYAKKNSDVTAELVGKSR